MVWVVGALAVWLGLAVLAGVVIGRAIKLADTRRSDSRPLSTADLPGFGVVPVPVAAKARRRAVPLPPVGVCLAALAVGLETVGFVLRLRGATGPFARAMSMDGPYSVPRTFVAVLFAVAAVAAVAGAGRGPGRRGWWLGVALVAAAVATVKAGRTDHSDAISVLAGVMGEAGAHALSAATAVAVVGALWFLSRTDRRDRRRVLSALGLYAVASVGLSAVSGLVAGSGGANLTAAATYLEESGEALAGVAFLLAVLVGVAPRLVLPAEWALRRTADAETLDAPVLDAGRRRTAG